MEKNEVIEALKRAKDSSQKRNFKQSVDLIINLKGLDLKKQESNIDIFVPLRYEKSKKNSVCALVGPELHQQAKGIFDETILADDFIKFNDKKSIKKLANKHDYFVAQADIMPKIATTFGKVLGPRGKMPNPKVGCIVPPNANLKPLYENLQKTVRLATKNNPIIQCSVGKEDTNDDEIVDNVLTVYNAVVHTLPAEKNNVKNACLKLTMGKSVKIGKAEEAGEKKGSKKTKIKAEEKAKPKEEEKKEAKEEKQPKEIGNKKKEPKQNKSKK